MPPFYAFTALWYLRPTSALWILYLLHSGWSLWQVGLAEAGFHAVSLLSDLPTGAFADRYGRRLSLAVGLFVGAADPLAILLTAPWSVPLGTLSVALGALGYTFVGGADRALLYAIARDAPEGAAGYGRLYGRVVRVSYVAETVGAAAGGLLATRLGWAWPFALAALSQFGALLAVLALPATLGDRPAAASGRRPRPALALLADAVRTLRERPFLLRFVLFGGVLLTVTALTNLYAQSTFVLKGASVATATFVIAGANLAAAATSAWGGRLAQGTRARTLLAGGAVALAALVTLVGRLPLLGSGAAFLAQKGTDGLLDPLYETRLNHEAPEAVRATVLSAPSSLFSLAMVVLFPLAGLVMAAGHLALAYMAVGALLLLSTLLLVVGSGRSVPSRPTGGALVRREP